MEIIKSVSIAAYYVEIKSDEGNFLIRTCAESFPEGKVCKFLTTRKLGLVDVCCINNKDVDRGDLGWLEPVKGCIIDDLNSFSQ